MRVNPRPVYWDSAGEKIVHLDVNGQYSDVPTGGGFALESYQNSVMTAPVMAYIFRDVDDNIFRVYEPIRNNDVSRSFFDYAGSIDKFPFDNTECFNATLLDCKLVDVDAGIKIQGSMLRTIVFNGRNNTGIQIINHNHVGNYGQDSATGEEISISGNDVTFSNNPLCAAIFFDMAGSSTVSNSVFGYKSLIHFNSKSGVIDKSIFEASCLVNILKDSTTIYACQIGVESEWECYGDAIDVKISHSGKITFQGSTKSLASINTGDKKFVVNGDHVSEVGVVVYISNGSNKGYYDVDAVTLNGGNTEITVEQSIASSSTVGGIYLTNLFNSLSAVSVEISATLAPIADLLEVNTLSIGVGGYALIASNQSNKNFTVIEGTTYELGVTAGAVTATAV